MAEENSYEQLHADIEDEYIQTKRDLKEIDVLIKQSAAEVERLAQRNAQATAQTRQLQMNYDTQPRDYIRDIYEGQIDVQQRLFTMRGQLEKLQSSQRYLERLFDFQRRFLEMGGDSDALSTENAEDGSPIVISSSEQSTIIRIIQTEESAKQSLVREMHDGPASSLSNFILQAEICQRLFDVDPDTARAELNALKAAAAGTFNDIKNFIFDLRPMMLDDLGVIPTLRRYTEAFQENNDTNASFAITGVERRLESHIEVTVFRGVQELMNNALIHGRATQIQVLLDVGGEQITAVVEDNGSGFDVDEIWNKKDIDGIGISSLRERVNLLGGTLEIQSSPGQPTKAEFFIPIEN